MARNRVIYQSEALFVGPTTGGHPASHAELHRVQDISHDMSATRTDVYEFGRLASLEKAMIEAPTVTLDFSYLVTNGSNENEIGLDVAAFTSVGGASAALSKLRFGLGTFPSIISGIQAGAGGSTDEKNYYVVTVAEGQDADEAGRSADDGDTYNSHSVVGFGNAVLSNYSVNAAVGDFASASVSVEAFNVSFISGSKSPNTDGWVSGNALPTIVKGSAGLPGAGFFDLPKPTTGTANVFALRPGDIEFNFDAGAGYGTAGTAGQLNVGGAIVPTSANRDPDTVVEAAGIGEPMHIQNFSIDAPLTRTALTRLGSTFPYYRAIDFPLNVTMNVSALLADVQTGALIDLMCNDETRQIDIGMRVPCSSSDNDPSDTVNCLWRLKNARLVSQNFAATIGDNKTVDLSFEASYGGATDTDNGLFISGTPNIS